MVLAVGFVDLVERLRDEEAADAVARHEGQRRLEEVERPSAGNSSSISSSLWRRRCRRCRRAIRSGAGRSG
jgi:hypothetical protein